MPIFFVSSAACAAPPANESAHKKSFSRSIVQQNVAQKISPTPVVSNNSRFGNRIEYTLSFTKSDIFCLLVNMTFSTPNFCNDNNAASSLAPVSANNSLGLTLIAETPSRSNFVSFSIIRFSEL